MKKAFTIIELLVAMAIIVILLAGSGYVFHTSVKAERAARATAEITRKLRGITDQLNEDFRGIRYDGEMFFAWLPQEVYDYTDPANPVIARYGRFDQMMFFTNGNFSSYGDNPAVKGNLARVQYTLAVDSNGNPPEAQDPSKRVLARVQHIYTPTVPSATPAVSYFPDLLGFNLADFISGERDYEYDNTTMAEWKNADVHVKEEALTVLSNLSVDIVDDDNNPSTSDVGGVVGSLGTPTGVIADASTPTTIHKILCEGVGEFKIQVWRWVDYQSLGISYPHPPQWRWWPENDPDGDGDYADTDLIPDGSGGLDTSSARGYIHPGDGSFFNFFGHAFKFTFTLYDSYGVFPEGKTFTHIIYLD